MNGDMAYLLGMIAGNGEIQRGQFETTVVIEIPFKNLTDDLGRDVNVYVTSSLFDLNNRLAPVIGRGFTTSETEHAIRISFTKDNRDYVITEIMRYIPYGSIHNDMRLSPQVFSFTRDEKIEFLRGFSDATGYIRDSNKYRGLAHAHRVYLEVPGNWDMVIDICNLLKQIGVPVQNIDFGHPNIRDGQVTKYSQGYPNFWKKEHQIKVFANEFIPIGFNLKHKNSLLNQYADDLVKNYNGNTHKFYWERRKSTRKKPPHPGENDPYLPQSIRGKHYNSWTELAHDLGYHE